MKKHLLSFLTLILILGVWSCKPDRKEEPAFLKVPVTSVTFGAGTESKTIKFETNRNWQITDIPQWLIVEPGSGEAGELQVKFTAKENPDNAERQARLSLKAAENVVFLSVKQTVKTFLTVKDKEFFFFAQAKKIIINCEGNVNPEVIIPQEAKSWLKFVSNDVKKDSRVILDMSENQDVPRQAEVKIVDKASNISETVLIKQYPDPKVDLQKEDYYLHYNQSEFVMEFDSNIPFNHELEGVEGDWISVKSSAFADKKFKIVFDLKVNDKDKMRFARLILKNTDCDKNYIIKLTQAYRADSGQAVLLHKATYAPSFDWTQLGKVVKRPTFIFTGDGFTKEDIENGTYQKFMMEAYNAIFNTEPFKALKDRFSAWILYAESREKGITTIEEHEAGKHRDTHYGVYFEDRSRGMTLTDFDGVIDRCKKSIEKAGGEYHVETGVVVMVANTPVYGGTCMLSKTSGKAIAICSTSESEPGVFPRIVSHEAGGHGFGKLADEYSTGGGPTEGDKKSLRWYQEETWVEGVRTSERHYMNVTLESDKNKAPWAWMYGLPGYEEVDHFEGGHTFASGVWRSSRTSLMKDNRIESKFNAYSRYLIFERLYNIYENIDNIRSYLPDAFRPRPLREWFLEVDKPNTKK
ncbi:M64 family metallopeptidase [Porphyromonas sp.]|uniref:BACON domain-containing protein n=1 Tax=Porphyromonas sp. TaxID=1924944 RepID=UPI0026DBDDD7|nr:M64 family metallopeptidase [Porphyromonas sp.]MDO4770842.1 M64 family metallopeptidase [Porphyromonas sp.]